MTPEERAIALLDRTGILALPKSCTALLRYALPDAIREAEDAALERAAQYIDQQDWDSIATISLSDGIRALKSKV